MKTKSHLWVNDKIQSIPKLCITTAEKYLHDHSQIIDLSDDGRLISAFARQSAQ
jgi:hypothetical protein